MIHDSLCDTANDNASLKAPLMKWWPSSILPPAAQICCTLFPTLAGWKSKNIAERLLGIIAAPSVFLLTITVPVIEPQVSESDEPDPFPAVIIEQFGNDGNPAPRVRLPADSPTLHPIGHDHIESLPNGSSAPSHPRRKSTHQEYRPRWDSEFPAVPHPAPDAACVEVKDWNRWLTSIQLFTGPFFVTLIAWSTVDEDLDPKNLILPSLVSLLFSFLCLSVLVTSTRRRRPWHHHSHVDQSYLNPHETSEMSKSQSLPSAWRPFLSLLGFLVAISWIATIATEVVSVLKTIGVILNISDSLLGLTIFAVGNSLGDLVADITVARLGYPVMALSACFGGPMLNILLGIGLGGLYMTLSSGKSSPKHDEMLARVPYEIIISKMLVISGATLLLVLVGLLIVVPLNNWRMDRRIGWSLIAVWCVSTLGSVIVEVAS
jgi:sodium/potassium/calcium exchanger 6